MRIRESARAVVLNSNKQILLFQFSFPGISCPGQRESGPLWTTPGGEVESSESDEAALKRELWEETGIEVARVGPPFWIRDIELAENGEPFLSRERYYLICLRDNPKICLDHLSQEERHAFHTCRWFSVEELFDRRLNFSPPQIGLYLREVLNGNVPNGPLRIE